MIFKLKYGIFATIRMVTKKYGTMPRQVIDEWDGLTDYRPPIFEEYVFELEGRDPKSKQGVYMASINYAREIVDNMSNELWVERRKLTDAFKMGIEYAKRYGLNI